MRKYTVRDLRKFCPCTTCRERRTAPPPTTLSPAETQPLRITAMAPTGRYAYSIHFSDGHDTGIYTLELLRELETQGVKQLFRLGELGGTLRGTPMGVEE